MSDRIEERILELIDKNREQIIDFGRDIYTHAELGFKEFCTAEKFEEVLKSLGLETQDHLAVTGVKGYLKGKEANINLALIGELDALRIPDHPFVNPETQAAHACGHCAQLTGVIGAALALSDPEVREALDGNVIFFAVPAEEYGEIEFKNRLKEEGKIRYGGGKSELIRIGAFDDVDVAVTHHSGPGISAGHGTSNGFVSKVVRYIGREAHAAGAPEKGVNALNAAALGLSALAFQRETFRDQDAVRVHPILTRGGNLVNVIPNEAVIETLVRGKDIAAIKDADKKTDRAFKAGADAIGAGYEIETMPGYLPQIPEEANEQILEAIELAVPGKKAEKADSTRHGAGSSDVGDVQHILPVLHFSTGGVTGAAHSCNYLIEDEEEAYVTTAKIFALSAYKLLKEHAKAARKIKENYKPIFTKDEYVDFMESLIRKETKEIDE